MIHRRKFLVGLGALMAAPAIVHAGNLMPVKVMQCEFRTSIPTASWRMYNRGVPYYAEQNWDAIERAFLSEKHA